MAKLALTPHFPTYQQACEFVRTVDGIPLAALHSMMSAIRQQMGTPQEQVDWTEPDTWISTRLGGQDADLARRMWSESRGVVNPRHVRGTLTLARRHELIEVDAGGVCRKTPIGDAYMTGDLVTHQRIDGLEGVDRVLLLLSSRTSATTPELLSEWLDYLRSESSIYSEAFARHSLWARLRYLVTRGLATRNGSYVITTEGREYLDRLKDGHVGADSDVARAAFSHNTRTQEKLKEALAEMNPFLFEELIGELLTAMGYQDVEVTAATGDKGVDVVASIQMGITDVTEVIQVKRRQSNLGRVVVDRLRGALPYHKAIRGTIVTLGGFSAGCKEAAVFPGAAPITLMGGDRLLNLLFQYEIGVSKRDVSVWDFDPGYFAAGDNELSDC